MLGAIIGDIAGSTYEFMGNKDISVSLFPKGSDFTDDSILAVATADAVLHGNDYRGAYLRYGADYPSPMGGYGVRFSDWLRQLDPKPYGSWGNGSAMRVAPVGWAFGSLEETLKQAEASAIVSHDHPEGVKGAQATAAAVWLARHGRSKHEIREFITSRFAYDLSRSVDEIRAHYEFDESCQGTVPEALIAFLDSRDFEHAIRVAISLGGDADTVACITGAVAEAYYRVIPAGMLAKAEELLPEQLLAVVNTFRAKFVPA